jgi:hypothetical protein
LLTKVKLILKAKKLSDTIIPETNKHYINETEFVAYDRIYGSIFKEGERLIQKDGTIYEGKLHKGPNGCRYTDDGRWFDKSGMPIDK